MVTFQLGSPLLDGCLLAVLAKGNAYGYSLTQQIKEIIGISESTLYPILRRLQREGYLAAYDQPYQGRNRRYYAITPSGLALLDECRNDWNRYCNAIGSVLYDTGGEAAEQEKEWV